MDLKLKMELKIIFLENNIKNKQDNGQKAWTKIMWKK